MTIRRIEAPLYSTSGFDGLLDAASTVAQQFGAEIEVCFIRPIAANAVLYDAGFGFSNPNLITQIQTEETAGRRQGAQALRRVDRLSWRRHADPLAGQGRPDRRRGGRARLPGRSGAVPAPRRKGPCPRRSLRRRGAGRRAPGDGGRRPPDRRLPRSCDDRLEPQHRGLARGRPGHAVPAGSQARLDLRRRRGWQSRQGPARTARLSGAARRQCRGT